MALYDLVIPNPSTWNHKWEYQRILEGVAALVENYENLQECEILINRIIKPFFDPLMEKLESLNGYFVREGRKLGKEEINESLMSSI